MTIQWCLLVTWLHFQCHYMHVCSQHHVCPSSVFICFLFVCASRVVYTVLCCCWIYCQTSLPDSTGLANNQLIATNSYNELSSGNYCNEYKWHQATLLTFAPAWNASLLSKCTLLEWLVFGKSARPKCLVMAIDAVWCVTLCHVWFACIQMAIALCTSQSVSHCNTWNRLNLHILSGMSYFGSVAQSLSSNFNLSCLSCHLPVCFC